ncbi:hypothetical protein Tco_0557400 [Tanacetum coccineum]
MYEVEGYTEEIVQDYEQRLDTIFSRQVNRNIFGFARMNVEMSSLTDRMEDRLLGGPRRSMILRQFILALGLYTTEEMAGDGFEAYWVGSLREIANKGDLSDYRARISSDGDFVRVVPSYTSIRDILRRLCQRLIAVSISSRGQAPEKVTATNLFYLRSMDEGTSVNIPYLLSHYLFRHNEGRKRGARDDDFHSQHHDDHQDDDAPPEGEKRVKRHKTSTRSKSAWVKETIIDEDAVILEDETPELITKFQKVDKRVPTNFDHARMKATLNDMLTLVFYVPQRNPNEPPRYLYNKDLIFLKNGNTEETKYTLSLRKIHAEPFPEADLEEKMNHWVLKEFKNFNEDARLSIQHWKDSWHKRLYRQNQRKARDNPQDYFSNHKITIVVRITTDQLYGLDFMKQIIMIRENDKPDSFSEADFKYLNKNDIEDLYYLFQNKKVNYRETNLMNSLITFIRSRVIWERVHDFQLAIESY